MKPINLFEVEAAMEDVLSPAAYGYYADGAGDEVTLRANRADFDTITLYPRMLVDVSQRDPSTTLLGQSLKMPLGITPMAMAKLGHPDGEAAIAEAAKDFGIPYCVSTLTTTPLETLTATGANIWFQLYVHRDRGLTRALVERAEAAGCSALVVTVDVPVAGIREKSLSRQALTLPEGVELELLAEHWDKDAHPSINAYIASQFDPSLTWDDIAEFASSTRLPVLVKGILRAEDARRAVDSGAAAVFVSNHGGRQLDTAPSAIAVLPTIADTVSGAVPIVIDGGVRRGTDIIKALALGADAVFIGRPIFYGLALDGADGVRHVLGILHRELDTNMALCGCASVDDMTADLLHV